MSKIRAIVVKVGQPAVVAEVEPTLEAYQGIVGGYVEALTFSGCTFYFNEDGRSLGLPYNRRLGAHNILGDFLVVGPPDASGGETGLSAELAEYLTKRLNAQRPS